MREGYDPAYGARPLRRVVQRRIENEYRFAEVASQGAAEPVSVAA